MKDKKSVNNFVKYSWMAHWSLLNASDRKTDYEKSFPVFGDQYSILGEFRPPRGSYDGEGTTDGNVRYTFRKFRNFKAMVEYQITDFLGWFKKAIEEGPIEHPGFVLYYNKSRLTHHDNLEDLVDCFFDQFKKECISTQRSHCNIDNITSFAIGTKDSYRESVSFKATFIPSNIHFPHEWVSGVKWHSFHKEKTLTLEEAKENMLQWCKSKEL